MNTTEKDNRRVLKILHGQVVNMVDGKKVVYTNKEGNNTINVSSSQAKELLKSGVFEDITDSLKNIKDVIAPEEESNKKAKK